MSEEKRITHANLEQHLARLQDIENEIAPEQELEFQLALQEALMQVAEKRDRVAFVIWDLLRQAGVAERAAESHIEEAARLRNRAQRFEKQADRLKNQVISVMRTLPKPKKGPRRLPGLTSTLKANGVPPSVDVLDESQVPLEYKRVTVKMSAEDWEATMAVCGYPVLVGLKQSYEVDCTALLEALKKPCSKCGGDGLANFPDMTCPACNGTGKQLIPGARLETEKLRLVIE